MKNDTNTLFYACRLLVVNFSKRAIFFKNSTIFSRDMKCISYTIEDNAFSSKHTNCLLFLKSNRKKSFSLEQISSSDIWSPFSGGIIWRTRSSHVNFPPLKSTGYWGRGGGGCARRDFTGLIYMARVWYLSEEIQFTRGDFFDRLEIMNLTSHKTWRAQKRERRWAWESGLCYPSISVVSILANSVSVKAFLAQSLSTGLLNRFIPLAR